jgi:hypothetical protein
LHVDTSRIGCSDIDCWCRLHEGFDFVRHFYPKLPFLMRSIVVFLFLAIALAAPAAETETLYLSGHGSDDAQPWDFYCTGGRNSGFWTKINVPSCWEQQGFGTYEYGVELRPSNRLPSSPRPRTRRGSIAASSPSLPPGEAAWCGWCSRGP